MLLGTGSGSALFLLICHPTGREPKATPLPPACSLGLDLSPGHFSDQGGEAGIWRADLHLHACRRERAHRGAREHLHPMSWALLCFQPCICCWPRRAPSFQCNPRAVRLGLMVTGWLCTTCINKGSKKTSSAPSLLRMCCDTKREPSEEEIQPLECKILFSLKFLHLLFPVPWCFLFSPSHYINSIEHWWDLNSVPNPKKVF